MTTITTKIAESGRTSFQLDGKRASKAAAIEAAIANMKNGSDNLVDIQIAIDAAKKTVRFDINYYGEIIWQEIKSVKQYKSIGGGHYETYYSPEWTRTTEERANELLAEFGLNTEIICKMVFADNTTTEVEYKPQTKWENPHDFTTVGNLNGQPRKYVDPEVFSLLPALDDLNDVEDEDVEEIEMPLVVLKDKLTDLTEQSSQLFNYIHCSDDRQKADAAFKGEMQLICSGRDQSPERRQIEAENEARLARIVVAEAHYSCLQNDCAKLVAAIASNGRITKRNWEVIMDKKPHVLNNTGNCEWYTPPAVIDAVLDVLDEIDLDPASSRIANEIVGAKKFFTRDDDGLKHDWLGKIFCNPPYSRGLIDKFVVKLLREFAGGRTTEAIVLTNAATDTDWAHKLMALADQIIFTKKRLKFLKPDGSIAGNPTCGQMFCYFGERSEKFYSAFSQFGLPITFSLQKKYKPPLR